MSTALDEWQGKRRARLERLSAAHALVRNPVNRLNPEYLNWTMLLAVASEFQGFARDLHDLAVEAFVVAAAPGNVRLAGVIRRRLVHSRALDSRNPQPDALAEDFGRLGLPLWRSLGDPPERTSLATLLTARNAVAHADVEKLDAIRVSGHRLTVQTIKRWRGDLDALAAAMDACVATHHASLFASAKPW